MAPPDDDPDPPDPSRPDLSEVDTDHLIDELKRRSQAVLVARLPLANPEGNAIFDPHGSKHTCIGLAVDAAWSMLNDADDDD